MTIRIFLVAALLSSTVLGEKLELSSPRGRLKLAVENSASAITWSLAREGRTLVAPSPLGLVFARNDGGFDRSSGTVAAGMKTLSVRRRSVDSTWENPCYRRRLIRDRFNEMEVTFEESAAPSRRIGLVFRAYEEGVAFRYFVPEQPGMPGFQLVEELTEWRFPVDADCYATLYKDHVNSQERAFEPMKLGAIPQDRLVGMPLVVRCGKDTIALTEAALVNWAGMFFRRVKDVDGKPAMKAELSPLPPSAAATSGAAVIRTTPAASPWRVVICGNDELELLGNNDIIINLNDPPDPSIDFSFVKPGASSWDWWAESNNSLSTDLTLELVDFAAEMGWPYHTIDGGWYGFARRPNHGPNVELRPRAGFDLERIVSHARAKGVGIWVWIHCKLIDDVGIDETFARLAQWGVKGVKTDFINRQDQEIVLWYERVCRSAAKHRVMVNFHGAFKPTGTERTWPNNLTREGVMGNEMSKFNGTINPVHTATLPFTRFLLGPADYTPGSFGNVFEKEFVPQVRKGHRYGDENDRRRIFAEEIGTRAHALALCVAYDSPLTTLCDWPERYRNQPGQAALKSLPTVWRRTEPLAGRIGEYYAVAREAEDGRWYVAAITVAARKLPIKLDFLGAGAWQAQIWSDDFVRTPANARALKEDARKVVANDSLELGLVAEGGALVILDKVRAR